ncbi:MAG: exopolysaccharide biosynthesis protein [Candidatus Accumulibacter sp.]|jgi:hypothetical protein|nr:exopolysaccharide biosynthesis protein [Accumulibacter sp.]
MSVRPHRENEGTGERSSADGRLPLSEILRALAEEVGRERIFIRDLVDALGDRALAALMFVFALPNVFPTPPGTSAVLGTPLVFLTAQLALGRGLWLPEFIRERSLPFQDFQALARRVAPWLARAENLLCPRVGRLVDPPMEYLIGIFCFVLAAILALPIPLGNIPPAIAICLFALGLLERDGAWATAGFLAATVALAIVSGVFFALFETSLFVKEWLS